MGDHNAPKSRQLDFELKAEKSTDISGRRGAEIVTLTNSSVSRVRKHAIERVKATGIFSLDSEERKKG